METARLSETVKLSNEELGSLYRRLSEIIRRIKAGNLKLPDVMTQLQRVVEDKASPMKVYVSRANPLEFERLPENKRHLSRASWSNRLPHSLMRLEYPERDPEQIMVEMWEAECVPVSMINSGATPLNAIMGTLKPTPRDVQVISSTLQWLGTKMGSDFLRRFIRVSQIWLG